MTLGTLVITSRREEESTDWTEAAKVSRRFPAKGIVCGEHDAHGLTYEVRHHVDGSIGHYEPEELIAVVVDERDPNRGLVCESAWPPDSADGEYVVRLYDGFDNHWVDVSRPVSREEAFAVWREKTEDGTQKSCFEDIDYFRIFPVDRGNMLRAARDGEGKPIAVVLGDE